MEKVEKEAKKEGFEVPPILSDLDEKTGRIIHFRTIIEN